MRKNIVVDGLLQCLVGDQRFAGVCRLRRGRNAAEERECACNRESNEPLSTLHTSRSSITQNGPAGGTRQPYSIVAEVGDDLRNIFPGGDTVASTMQLTPKYPAAQT